MSRKKIKTNSRETKPRTSFVQRKMRRQQIFMAVVAIILVLTMVLALALQY
jgi:predicted nucleic acid-binding Zn ribbon protein